MISSFVFALAVYFSPHGGAEAAIIDAVNHAAKEIHLQAYSYTSEPIDDAIVAAQKRGVKVSAILDAGANAHNKMSQRWELAKSGASVVCDDRHPIAHAKIIIIDDTEVLCGSFNFSLQAEQKNSEDLVVIDDIGIVGEFLANWAKHAEHAKSCEQKATKAKKGETK